MTHDRSNDRKTIYYERSSTIITPIADAKQANAIWVTSRMSSNPKCESYSNTSVTLELARFFHTNPANLRRTVISVSMTAKNPSAGLRVCKHWIIVISKKSDAEYYEVIGSSGYPHNSFVCPAQPGPLFTVSSFCHVVRIDNDYNVETSEQEKKKEC